MIIVYTDMPLEIVRLKEYSYIPPQQSGWLKENAHGYIIGLHEVWFTHAEDATAFKLKFGL